MKKKCYLEYSDLVICLSIALHHYTGFRVHLRVAGFTHLNIRIFLAQSLAQCGNYELDE